LLQSNQHLQLQGLEFKLDEDLKLIKISISN
jgi:hypothetical protein